MVIEMTFRLRQNCTFAQVPFVPRDKRIVSQMMFLIFVLFAQVISDHGGRILPSNIALLGSK